MSVLVSPVSVSTVVVAVDVGKSTVALSATTACRQRLFGPVDFPMTAGGLCAVLDRVHRVLPGGSVVLVGVEAAGHCHRPLLVPASWPAGWKLLELNPAHVTEQRRAMGRRRVKTDAIDLEAITELVLAGRGVAVQARAKILVELSAWAAHRSRRITTRTATKNQLLGQLDRCFPGLALALPDVLGTKVGRLVAAEFTDPGRLATMGASRFIRFAAHRDVQVRRPIADRLVTAARDVLPMPDAAVARQVITADLQLLNDLDIQIAQANQRFTDLLPATSFATLTTVPGWGVVRAGNYAAAVKDPARWPGHAQLYRASGLSPMQYESAGRRRDGAISREGSVELRRALIDLGVGLWLCDRPSKTYAEQLKARGKRGAIIACALAHRANKLAYALTRDQAAYDPNR